MCTPVVTLGVGRMLGVVGMLCPSSSCLIFSPLESECEPSSYLEHSVSYCQLLENVRTQVFDLR